MSAQKMGTKRSWWKYALALIVLVLIALAINSQTHVVQFGVLGGSSPTATDATAEEEDLGPPIDFSIQDLSGQPVRLSDHLGKVVLVNFWATWCSPCREEMPFLQDYYADHMDQGFVLIGINVSERPEEVARYVEEAGYIFPIWLDPPGNILIDLRVNGLPASLLIDREGHLRRKWIGPLTEDLLEVEITPLLLSSAP
jgi:cytochrome c biogenesis protein CcmG/thiol:disulfide interchange protein DsbE